MSEKQPECPVGEKNCDIVSMDITAKGGFCVCLLPETNPYYQKGERIALCWFKDNYRESEEYFSLVEAAIVGGGLVYAAAILCSREQRK